MIKFCTTENAFINQTGFEVARIKLLQIQFDLMKVTHDLLTFIKPNWI